MKELQAIINKAHAYYKDNIRCVLATIVKIEGSGYRRQGTRMMISEHGDFTGAISGGCVEKEVWLQSSSVFKTVNAKLITYDGRYRLGCEGTLFILIEPLDITLEKLKYFQDQYSSRTTLELNTYFIAAELQDNKSGTYFFVDNMLVPLGGKATVSDTDFGKLESYSQRLNPVRSLYIFGSEHDSVSLCKIASEVGWDVTIVAHPLNEKAISFFKGAKNLCHLVPEDINSLHYDEQTACILMSHSYSRDLAYLLELSKKNLPYIGLLGPQKRKNQIIGEIMDRHPEVSEKFLDSIYGPTGLDIGAETPQEIAISILAELQSVFTQTEVDNLRNKTGSIHERQS